MRLFESFQNTLHSKAANPFYSRLFTFALALYEQEMNVAAALGQVARKMAHTMTREFSAWLLLVPYLISSPRTQVASQLAEVTPRILVF